MNEIDFPYFVSGPNERIPIASGDVRIGVGGEVSSGPGSFTFDWEPTPRIVLSTTQTMKPEVINHVNDGPREYELVGISRIGNCHLLQASFSGSTLSSEEVRARYYVIGELFIGSPAPVEELLLGVANLDDRLRFEGVNRPAGGGAWRGGLTVELNGYRFEIHSADPSVFDSGDYVQQGGYAVTHVVRVKKLNDKTIDSAEADRIRFAVRNWLTFVRGKRVGLPVMMGRHDGTIRWESWFGVDVAPRANELPWFPDLLVSIFPSETISSLSSILSFFLNYRDDSDELALLLAIDWYIQISTSTRPNTRIALTAFGLEQFAWWDLKLKGWLNEEGFDRLTLADTVGLCMARASLPTDLPTNVGAIVGARITKSPKGSQLIAEARNSVVHPKSKNFDVQSLSPPEAHIISEYAIQQLELLLLSALGYRGSYLDRVDEYKEKLVPWA
jgi:hypothetical protein